MLQDNQRTKTKKPGGGGGPALELEEVTNQTPGVDDILLEVDRAIKKAKDLQLELSKPQSTCGCGG